jgi:hypothetical protein
MRKDSIVCVHWVGVYEDVKEKKVTISGTRRDHRFCYEFLAPDSLSVFEWRWHWFCALGSVLGHLADIPGK